MRDALHLGDLLERQADEIFLFHEVGLARIVGGQGVEGIVDEEQFVVVRTGRDIETGGIGADVFELAAVPGGVFSPSIVDKNAPHGFGGRREEVGTVVPHGLIVADAEPNLMDECGGLEGLAWVFPRKAGGGKVTQLVVYEGQQLRARLRIALLDPLQDQSDLTFAHAAEFAGCTREMKSQMRADGEKWRALAEVRTENPQAWPISADNFANVGMKPHTAPHDDGSEEGYDDIECDLACNTAGDELRIGHQLMKSWSGSAAAAMAHEGPTGPRAGRHASGYTLAALKARIDELTRENLELRTELARRLRIETALRRAKPGAKVVARLDRLQAHRALVAPGYDLEMAPRPRPAGGAR